VPFNVTRNPGSTYVITPLTTVGVLQQLASRNGGEVVSADQY
jgi:hypothetical protein